MRSKLTRVTTLQGDEAVTNAYKGAAKVERRKFTTKITTDNRVLVIPNDKLISVSTPKRAHL